MRRRIASQRRRRVYTFVGSFIIAGSFWAWFLWYFDESLNTLLTPTQFLNKNPPVPAGKQVMLGGLVLEGSLNVVQGEQVEFVVTDLKNEVSVTYTGQLPDIFNEGSGCVCRGYFKSDGTFTATGVLAKHDEKYIPYDIKLEVDRHRAELEANYRAEKQKQKAAQQS